MVPYRVLVADPDELLLKSYQRFFPPRYWTIGVARTGLECIVQLREFRPHLLVLEPALPWGGGAGVLEQMYRESDLPVVPVIVFTAGQDAIDAMRGFAVADVVRKPLDPYDLAHRIRSVLDTLPAKSRQPRNGRRAFRWKEPPSRMSAGNQKTEFGC